MIVDAAVTRALQLSRVGIPAHAASEMRARRIERRHRRLAGLHQEHDAAIDDLAVAVLTHHAQSDRRGRVVGESAETARWQPALFSPHQARRHDRAAEHHAERPTDGRLNRLDDAGKELPPLWIARGRVHGNQGLVFRIRMPLRPSFTHQPICGRSARGASTHARRLSKFVAGIYFGGTTGTAPGKT